MPGLRFMKNILFVLGVLVFLPFPAFAYDLTPNGTGYYTLSVTKEEIEAHCNLPETPFKIYPRLQGDGLNRQYPKSPVTPEIKDFGSWSSYQSKGYQVFYFSDQSNNVANIYLYYPDLVDINGQIINTERTPQTGYRDFKFTSIGLTMLGSDNTYVECETPLAVLPATCFGNCPAELSDVDAFLALSTASSSNAVLKLGSNFWDFFSSNGVLIFCGLLAFAIAIFPYKKLKNILK